MEVFEAPDKVTPFPHDKIGAPVASIITGQDTQWDDAAATWRTRDGKLGWSGGKIDTAKRTAALKEFLATNPPASIAKKAQAALAETK